ncbi:hypothetical protein [Algoriphagus limi]|uniref:Lysozyme inhibitor of I-type lysozyme n=1 Tax=Algoriphagus limi TaxID=2975273 RepID=A0ABT2G721_9BACT|nr:hypothetical protein [Algoriphagus limi]MCS5491059.1 hypothetical protein [Algoriphagus limi]
MKKIFLMALIGSVLLSCSQKNQEVEEQENPAEIVAESPDESQSSVFGNYVDEGYAQRDQGYDWVSVAVKPGKDGSISISVRSRADRKKPTCTYDTKAYPLSENQYPSYQDGKQIVFSFQDGSLQISTENAADNGILSFFCSGGATLEGTYQKIDGELDTEQIDPTLFSKVLNLQGIGFNVTSVKEEDATKLTVFTFGLKEQEYNESFDLVGEQVVDAEVEDLDSDGSPELMVYTVSDGSGSYGNVYGFSVNNLKSMSQVYFPPTSENPDISQGYMGHDEFALVETRLVQRFPIYLEGDSNANPTGGIRQVSYKLIPGEAMKKFDVDQVNEFEK